MLVWKELGKTLVAASCSKNHPAETNQQRGVQFESGTGVQCQQKKQTSAIQQHQDLGDFGKQLESCSKQMRNLTKEPKALWEFKFWLMRPKCLNTLENLAPCPDSLRSLHTPPGMWKHQAQSNFSCGSTVHAGKPEGAFWCIMQHLWAHVTPIFLIILLRMHRNMGMEFSGLFFSFFFFKLRISLFHQETRIVSSLTILGKFLPYEKK